MAKYLINVQIVSLQGNKSQGKMKETGGIFQDLEYTIQLAMMEVKAGWWQTILPETMFWKRWRDGWGKRDKGDENVQRLFFLCTITSQFLNMDFVFYLFLKFLLNIYYDDLQEIHTQYNPKMIQTNVVTLKKFSS